LPQPFAVKLVRDDDIEKMIAHKKEFEILQTLDHPNVVKAVEIFEDDFKHTVFQVMEYIEGQEIMDEIAESSGFTEEVVQSLYKQVLEGIAYLHSHHVCHRDIKPSNILITKDLSRVALVDFNVAKKKREDDMFMMFTKSAGTLAFCAPERLRESSVYTEQVDMWSAGIVLFMLLMGHHPFESNGSAVKLVAQMMDGQNIIQRAIDEE
jgi:calcium-dependent protein kinase